MSDSSGPDLGRESPGSRKRPRNPSSRYPRRRSLKACLVCRARKTKCDNVRPVCGFCKLIKSPCTYDDVEQDRSVLDPASSQILQKLDHIIESQDELMQTVHTAVASAPQYALPSTSAQLPMCATRDDVGWGTAQGVQGQAHFNLDFVFSHPEADSTSPSASASVAAARWFDLLAHEVTKEAVEETDPPLGPEAGFPDLFNGQSEDDLTPLQRATRIVDDLPHGDLSAKAAEGEATWQAVGSISLLLQEQVLFKNFLHGICPWLDLFDQDRNISTKVPHLAVRNAGLLNAIMALSSYHMSLNDSSAPEKATHQNAALQYYYQTLHYVQKAMRHSSYQKSQELMSTTLIIASYEMLRGSQTDWQQHLQGVYWILRSRQIEVETSSLESATWWAWLCQDIWVAFRQRRRTYSTWLPKKGYNELSNHEMASRSVWILSQVVNFCVGKPSEESGKEEALLGRIRWAKALKETLREWQRNLSVEFSPLPTTGYDENAEFKPLLIHPPCFGLAVQVHHVSRILLVAHEANMDGFEGFMARQKTIQASIDVVCGIGMTLSDEPSTMLTSQCLLIAGMFMQNPRQRTCVLEMLDHCRVRCGWPTTSPASELQQIWSNSAGSWEEC